MILGEAPQRVVYPNPLPRRCPLCNARHIEGGYVLPPYYSCATTWEWAYPNWKLGTNGCLPLQPPLTRHTEII